MHRRNHYCAMTIVVLVEANPFARAGLPIGGFMVIVISALISGLCLFIAYMMLRGLRREWKGEKAKPSPATAAEASMKFSIRCVGQKFQGGKFCPEGDIEHPRPSLETAL
jgi:hypothetical protein